MRTRNGAGDRIGGGIRAAVRDRLNRYQPGVLIGLSIIAGLLFGFVELAGEVMEGETTAFDKRILLALRDPLNPDLPGGPWWLARMARDITSLGSTTILAILTAATLGFLLLLHKRAAALLVLVSVGGGGALSTVLKRLFDRARPDLVPHGDQVISASFPSGHAMQSAVVYLTLGALLTQFVEGRRTCGDLRSAGTTSGTARRGWGPAHHPGRLPPPDPRCWSRRASRRCPACGRR